MSNKRKHYNTYTKELKLEALRSMGESSVRVSGCNPVRSNHTTPTASPHHKALQVLPSKT